MYRPSARALSLVSGGRGGVQSKYQWEEIEKTKPGGSQLGLSRTRTESIEDNLTSSPSDNGGDDEEDGPPVVNPRAQLFMSTQQPPAYTSSGWQTIMRKRNETLKERENKIEKARFDRSCLTKHQQDVGVVRTTKKKKNKKMELDSVQDRIVLDDNKVAWDSRTSLLEGELELESSELDEDDVIPIGRYSGCKPKAMSCKGNSRAAEEQNVLVQQPSQIHCMKDDGEVGLDQKANPKQQEKRKRRRLVRCKTDSPLTPCLPHEQIEAIAVCSNSDERKTDDKGIGRDKENANTIFNGCDTSDEESDDTEECTRTVLTQCISISERLSKAVRTWQGGNAVVKNVVSLTDMTKGDGDDSTQSSHVFTNAHVSTACPKLSLRPFQLVGVNWLSLVHAEGVNGVLADEMGLGKTVQTIAFLGLLYHRRHSEEHSSIYKDQLANTTKINACHIIVVPSSVLSNWEKEFEKFCPALNVMVYHGSAANRADIRVRGWGYYDNVDVVLTTYTMWERDSNVDDRRFILGKHYDYLVLDEGHFIKNTRGSRFLRLKRVRCNYRLLLTGTPVQNSVGELLSLLSFLMPGIFDEAVVKAAEEGSFLGAETTESERCVQEKLNERNVEFVRSMLAPFVLRRLKSSVLDQLAEKEVDVQLLQPQPSQQNLYSAIIEKHLRQRTGDGIGAYEARNVFVELRKAANHPLLLHNRLSHAVPEITRVLLASQHFGKGASKQQVEAELFTSGDYNLHCICLDYPSLEKYTLKESDLFTSAKFERLRSLLPVLVNEGRRILLFSQWTQILDLLNALLEVIGLRSLRLDGSTPVSERQALIDRFSEEDIPIFLLSTRAGGLGINLISADTVILHDVDFNPEVDAQAVDRCHRIGQERNVRVIKLITSGSVDENILRMSDRKRALSSAVLGTKGSEKEKYEDLSICQILQQTVKAYELSSDIHPAAPVASESILPIPT